MATPERLRSITYVGSGAYFLTACTRNRLAIFVCPAVVDLTLAHFEQAAREANVAVSAYCFMPDHLHLLVDAHSEVSDLGRFMGRGKQMSGYAFAGARGTALWQKGYHDRVLRSDDEILSAVAYMAANPIRAGLTPTADVYPFWGSSVYSREEILDAIAIRHSRRPG